MAFGKHWEWRGFGAVSESFIDSYGQLERGFGPQKVEDLYIWAPGLKVNIKIRTGALEELKFKRFLGRDGRLECWSEDPSESFEFPLQEAAWRMLAGELSRANLDIGSYPVEASGGDQLMAIVQEVGCKIVQVPKERGGRWWQGPNGRVLVEWAAIHKPQPVLSISLESEEVRADGLTHDQARVDLGAAVEALDLQREPLAVLNYLDATALWAQGDEIAFPGK